MSPGSLRFVGHATVELALGEAMLLTDPVLRERIWHLRRRGAVPELSRRPDAVLISHGHHDHLDRPSLRRLGGRAPLIVPRGLGGGLRRRGLGPVTELSAGEAVDVAGVTVLATPAEHDGRRWPLGPPVAALGFVIEGPPRIYFAGDTDLFDEMSGLGPVDVALLPVAGWGPRVGPGHLDPERAATAVEALRPALAVPIHWGTYASPGSDGGHSAEPARRFAALVARRTPATEVRVLTPGERLELG
jgi:L-ascorbate metabolism protein UlaG (beta-lactamase superfamily)